MAHQRFQYREFTAGQRHRLIFAEHLAGAEVQLELTKGDNRFFLRRRAWQFVSLTAQYGADTGQQLARVERFWDVVVGADFQAHDTVNFFPFRRDHNDRHRVALAAQAAANGQAIFARQHQIQHHQVEGFTGQQAIHLFSVRHATNLEALLGQITFE